MHQTFYIDIDEEITSIVDRVRKSKSNELVIVVPKRATLIQSIVNLKLLKKEAENFRKNLIVVTQDKLGKALIEKAGIEVEQKLDDVEGWEVDERESGDRVNEEQIILDKEMVGGAVNRVGKDPDKIGSDEYYQPDGMKHLESDVFYAEKRSEDIFLEKKINREQQEEITNRELVTDVAEEIKKQNFSFKKNKAGGSIFTPMDMVRNIEIVEKIGAESVSVKPEKTMVPDEFFVKNKKNVHGAEIDFESEDNLEKANRFFENRKTSVSREHEYGNIKVGSKAGKYLFLFTAVVILIIFGSAAYLFLPKTTIKVYPKNKIQSAELEIDGNSTFGEIDFTNEIVPAKIVTLSDELSGNYESSGTKDSLNQKAKGKITIYNEFSSSPQPLVATTRFQTADKKIFRLIKSVIVPGMEKIGGENKPGAIEAEVVADESGTEYNIEPAPFSIPGFESSGGDKYVKIYAKSFESMIGGGQGTQKIKTVSETDINLAKNKAMQELKDKLLLKLKGSVGDGYVFLEDAISIEDAVYTISKSAGDVADNFSMTVKAKINAVIFREDDVKNLAAASINKKGNKNSKAGKDQIALEFGKADVNFKEGKIIIRVHASGVAVPDIDVEKIKQGILGKKEEDIEEYVKNYTTDVEKIDISYWPSFMSGKISPYESRVSVSLDGL